MSAENPWPPVVVAVTFVALIGLILGITLPRGGDVDTFLKVWGAVGTLAGVATGAIPSFFFKRSADQASAKAAQAEHRAEQIERAALTLATIVDPVKHKAVLDIVHQRLATDR